MGRVDGKVAIVTGGARSMGAATARLFAREGAKVVFGDLRDDQGSQVEMEINASGMDSTYIHLDISQESDWQEVIRTALTKYGKLDILVNNAAMHSFDLVETATIEDWDTVMAVNARGTFLGIKHAVPAMRKSGGGSIVNITSMAAHVGSPTGGVTYTASKGAVRAMSRNTAIHYAQENIRCNSIYPGHIYTEAMAEALAGKGGTDEERLKRIPLGKWGRSEDIAYAVLFLASDESAFVTGQELGVDGGITAQ